MMNSKLADFWNSVRITPVKWEEDEYGQEGSGFWAVAIFNSHVIWYNDIEEGFNYSSYTSYGKIDEYKCEQDELHICLNKIANYYNK